MLGEYKVNRCTRQCYAEKRPLKDGEWYYSVVVHDGEELQRRDYSVSSWTEPPDGSVGHWKCRMPLNDEKKMVLAPREVLVDLLRQMEAFPEKAKTRYLLALLLLRRRIVRLPDKISFTSPNENDKTDTIDESVSSNEETKQEILQVEITDDGSIVDVVVCDIARSETQALTESLNELLYCEASELVEDDSPSK